MEPEKVYNPQEPVAVTLTAEQWQTVRHWMEHGADYHHCKTAEVLANCKDHRMAAQMVAEHENIATQAENVLKTIEAVLNPAPPPEIE